VGKEGKEDVFLKKEEECRFMVSEMGRWREKIS